MSSNTIPFLMRKTLRRGRNFWLCVVISFILLEVVAGIQAAGGGYTMNFTIDAVILKDYDNGKNMGHVMLQAIDLGGFSSSNYVVETEITEDDLFYFYLTIYDEADLSEINGTFTVYGETTAFSGNSSTYYDTNYLPTGENLLLQVSNESYTTRYYFMDNEGYTDILVDAYLIKSADSYEYVISVKDRQTSNPIQGAIISIERFDTNKESWVTVAQGETSASGQFVFNLQTGQLYRIKAEKDEYVTQYFSYTPSSSISTITIYMLPSAAFTVDSYLSPFRSISYAIITNKTTKNIKLQYNDTNDALNYVEFFVFNSTTLEELCHLTSSLDSGILICIVSDENGTYLARASFHMSDGNVYNVTRFVSLFSDDKFLSVGITDRWYQIFAYFFIFFVSFLFGAVHASAGAVAVTFFVILFDAFNWIDVSNYLKSILVVISLFAVMREVRSR